MTPEQRAELRRLCDEASRPPWGFSVVMGDALHRLQPGNRQHVNTNKCWVVGPELTNLRQATKDGVFCDAARTALPALLDYVETLEGEIERLKKLHEPKAETYACQRCGRRDGLDAVIPNQHWAAITEGTLLAAEVVDGKWNLLCLWCIDELCVQHGIKTGAYLAFCGANTYSTDDFNLEALLAQNYRITVTIEATAPAAAHGFAGKGSTVAEAVNGKEINICLDMICEGEEERLKSESSKIAAVFDSVWPQ